MANRNFLLQVLISAKDQASAVFDKIKQTSGATALSIGEGFKNALSVIGTITGAVAGVGVALDQTVGKAVAYAEEVRNLKAVTGLAADETSRLIQMAEDYGISAQTLETALGMMAKNGIAPTVENLIALADQYVNTSSSTERAAMMTEIFGRSWKNLAPLLANGGDALRDASAAVEENLILTDQAVADAEAYRLAVDELSDAWEGFKVKVGMEVIPLLTDLLVPAQQQQLDMTRYIVKEIDGEERAFIRVGMQLVDVTDKYKKMLEPMSLAEWATREYAGTVEKTIPLVDDLTESEGDLEAAARKTADVYRMAEEALRESNIAMDKKIELEEKIRLMSGDVTQEELDLEDAIGAITTALGRDYITRDQYLQWLLALATGASSAKDIIDALTAALLRIPKNISTTIDIRYRVHGGPNPVSEPGPDAPYNPPGPPGWDTYEPGDTMTMAPSGLGGKTAPMGSPSVVINQFLGPGLDENTLAVLTASEVSSAVAEATRAADNGGLRYAG